MMNLLALGLVVSTLAAAGVLTPPVNPPHHPDQVLREGHRVIVVEYERQFPADSATGVGNAEGRETVKALSESTKDKVCDAFGVCRDELSGAASGVEHAVKGAKDKISGFFHHGKEKMSDAEEAVSGAKGKLHNAKDEAENKLYQAKEATKDEASEAKDAAKDKLFHAKDATMDKLSHAKEVTKDKLSKAGKKTVDVMTEAKESAEDKLSQMKGGVEDKVSDAKGKIEDKLASAKNDAKEKLSEMGEEIKDKASHLKEEIKEAGQKAGDMAEETLQNLTDIARRARDVAYDMASYVASPRTSRAVWAVIQLLGFATAYGTCVWVTFISSHVLASALPRQQFGMVQSKVYPVYFRAIAYGVSLAFFAQYFRRDRGSTAEKLQAYNLLGAFGLVVVNMFILEPYATKIMFERMKAEKEEGRGHDISDIVEPVTTTTVPSVTGLASVTTTTTTAVGGSADGSFGTTKSTSHTEMRNEETATENKVKRLNIKLKKWNSYSSLVNVLTLMALTWHLVHLAGLLSRCQ